MKYIFYSLAIMFCFASCKKTEEDEKADFTKIKFESRFPLSFTVSYAGKTTAAMPMTVPLGEGKFEIYNKVNNQKIIDTTLNITGSETYYLVQPDLAKPPYLVTSPLSNIPAAPEGYMRLSIANMATTALPYEKVDVILLSNTTKSGINFLPLDTLYGVGAGYSEFFLVKRQVIGTTKATGYKFGFINSATGARILNFSGNPFYSNVVDLTFVENNVYQFNFTNTATIAKFYPTAIFMNPKYYVINETVEWSR